MDKYHSPIELAASQIGVKEDPIGSNDSQQIKAYLQSVGINFPAPWCMAFVYWCFHGIYGDSVSLHRSGRVLDVWNATKHEYRVTEPKTNDIVIFDFGMAKMHAGIVLFSNKENGIIGTIEGNTNDDGSREGYEVCYRNRELGDHSKVKGFIRLPELRNE